MNYKVDSITYKHIGMVHSPWKEATGTPIQSVISTAGAIIEISPEYEEGLKDLDKFSHLYILYHFHKVKRGELMVIPFLDSKPHGIFATRSPQRPNAIGLSVVVLERIEGNIIHIRNCDMLDGSPVLDIKPYIPQFDVFETSKNGWFEKNIHNLPGRKDDGRFA